MVLDHGSKHVQCLEVWFAEAHRLLFSSSAPPGRCFANRETSFSSFLFAEGMSWVKLGSTDLARRDGTEPIAERNGTGQAPR